MAKPAPPDVPILVDIRDPRCPPDIETVVRHKATELEEHFRHLTRVVVVIESAPTRGAGPCKVRVELDVPEGDVVVHQSEATDIQMAVIDAMDAAGKLVEERFGPARDALRGGKETAGDRAGEITGGRAGKGNGR